MRRLGGGRGGRLALSLVAAALVTLALAQLLLPRIAASRISSRVGRYGSVEHVSVSAWPAIELLWGDADSVRVRARRLALEPAQAAKLVWESRAAARVDFTAERVQLGRLALTDARMSKRGRRLSGAASVSEGDVQSALPEGFRVSLVRSEGDHVLVRASGGLFGVQAGLEAVAEAHDGKLVAHPLAFPLEGVQLTVFSDPRIYVEGVGASRLAGAAGGYRLSMRARLR